MDPVTATAEPVIEPVTACPVCGAISGTLLAQPPALLAVCDVLVVQALAAVGKRIVRAERARYNQKGTKPWHMAHTLWQPDTGMTDKALEGAWDVVPAFLDSHGCCGVTSRQVTMMLDKYVRDLLITGTPHDLGELRYRFESYLGIELAAPSKPYTPPGA